MWRRSPEVVEELWRWWMGRRRDRAVAEEVRRGGRMGSSASDAATEAQGRLETAARGGGGRGRKGMHRGDREEGRREVEVNLGGVAEIVVGVVGVDLAAAMRRRLGIWVRKAAAGGAVKVAR